MSVVSCLRGRCVALARPSPCLTLLQRGMGGGGPRQMPITPSRWQWHKFKDYLHFYTMLGVVPLGTLVFLVNVLVGPAKLAPIPDDYTPKEWEYHAHPISRFLARYLYSSHQQDYEKYLHFMFEENEKKIMRGIEKQVKEVMGDRGDTQAFYYRPILTKYHRMVREEYAKLDETRGQ